MQSQWRQVIRSRESGDETKQGPNLGDVEFCVEFPFANKIQMEYHSYEEYYYDG